MSEHLSIPTLLALVLLPLTMLAQKPMSLQTFPQTKVMVVAHRGDWRNAPENSLWAIRKAIEMGVDMVELDIALTKDSVLMLMHDKTLDRTTNGTGRLEHYTLKEIKQLYLRDGLGVVTSMRVPTLHEALQITKGRIFINLDKGYQHIKLVYPMLVKENMVSQVVFKGNASWESFSNWLGPLKDSINYMPIIGLEKGNGQAEVDAFLVHYKPYGFEFTLGNTEANLLDFKAIIRRGIRVWMNSLWSHHNAGHEDDKALEDPDVYSWYLKKGINIIQTDRPALLIDYLRSKGLK